jgi:protein-disulfide isomerase
MESSTARVELTSPPSSEDHSQGPDDVSLVLVEYADYQCPYCGEADRSLKQVREELSESFRFIFRNFPLIDSHPYALQAASAAEAAGLQGKFWEMHDLLFAHQRALDERSLRSYAEHLGLDVDRFKRDIAGDAVLDRIQRDMDSGEQSGVEGTPTFYIKGEKFEGAWNVQGLLSALTTAGGQ